MKIKDLIGELQRVHDEHGNFEVTCTASTLPDGSGPNGLDVFESTVENLVVKGGKVRLFM